MKHHSKHHFPRAPHSSGGRRMASHILGQPGMEPAGTMGGSDVEQAERMGLRKARGAPMGEPTGALGLAPGVGAAPPAGPPTPPPGPPMGGMPPEGGGL